MESWFKEVGRPALFDALAGVCDRIDNELDTNVKATEDENARLSAELARAKSRVSDLDQLEEENRRLRKELENVKNATRANTPNVEIRTPLAPKSVNQGSSTKRSAKPKDLNLDELKFSELKEEYLKLEGNYTKLHRKYSELEGAHAELNKLLHDLKKGYNQWKDHANQVDEINQKRSQTIKKLKAKLAATAAVASGPLDASFSSDTPVRPASRQDLVTPEFVENNISEELRPAPGIIRTESPLARQPIAIGVPVRAGTISTVSGSIGTHNGSGDNQTRDVTPDLETEFGAQDAGYAPTLPPLPQNQNFSADMVRIKHEPSSDTPVVVSERCVRKRKYDDNQSGAPRILAVKTEDGSDPLVTEERHDFVPHESIDLDAGGYIVHTPKKRYRLNPQPDDEITYPNEVPQLQASDRALGNTGNSNTRQRPGGRTMNDGSKPLRERPKSELCITDFKVNPATNEGYDYAFTEVVRSKDKRATLTGCVEENCCGPKFRQQANAMRGQTSPSDFHGLLEKYLGDEAWKLSTMSKPEKEDLWVKAKMQELSNEQSTHRHRYHRAPSPVGYWRMDFPTTQQQLQDKEEADRRLRHMVEERYREAMRPGGKWLFRDE